MSPTQPLRQETAEIQLPKLERSFFERSSMISALLSLGTWILAIIACVPLFSVLIMLIIRGGTRLSWETLSSLPPTAFEMGGGFGNAIIGTIVMVGIGMLISVPLGIMAAIFLAEFGPDSRISQVARFCAKTLTGLPSILAGVFAYAAVVLVTGTYSAPAGGIALSLLMIPTVMLTAEEAMKMVPRIMKDAAHGMGCTPSQVVWKVVVPTAMPGIITGVMLAVARAAGETAPLLFTALFSSYWLFEGGVDVMQPTASLAVLIYNFSGMPYENQIELAWTASLVLVTLVLVLNIISRTIGQRKEQMVTMLLVVKRVIGRQGNNKGAVK
ncbi:phosphate ABC transporter permease PstA [Desulfomonile tiedjei]|uniref:Phosphate transport system permease protein PstA n=1 Tax=Desulfomonile tiedjei (strain ATCC 49306 / DSM 6799 / DCB-1) TaxID=706587 RepID=I4C9F5_DESTA|nr:phosphate ABC transporter membrane protein 2, PhoT family [Desulfomonile tiedjei DSM 6799]